MLFLREFLFWCGHGKTVLQWLLIYNDDIWKYVCHGNQCAVHIENKFCHPGGHYWDYYPGALCVSQVTATHLKIRHPCTKSRVIKRQITTKLPRLEFRIVVPAMTARQHTPVHIYIYIYIYKCLEARVTAMVNSMAMTVIGSAMLCVNKKVMKMSMVHKLVFA